MKKKHRFYRGFLILVLCTVGLLYNQSEHVFREVDKEAIASLKAGAQVGEKATHFELQSLGGESVGLESLKGRPVVLHFFATWCGPCQEEMPFIVQLEKEIRQKGGIMLGINLTSQEASREDVRPFITHYRASFDPLLDVDGAVMKDYQIIGIPTTIAIDESGKIIKRINGMMTREQFDDLDLF